MPAVNPARLNQETEALAALLCDPEALRRKTIEVLSFYADRTKKPRADQRTRVGVKALGVSRAVLRVIASGLRHALEADPVNVHPAADSLWRGGVRETQYLAVLLLGAQSRSEVSHWTEEWLASCNDAVILQALADEGLKSWRQECSQEFMDTVAGWSNAPDVQTRVFALQALAAAVGEGSFENLPAAFGMVRGVADRAVKGERQALDQLVRTLARRSAPETTRFLMDELERGGGGAERMCRTALPHLPPRHRARLNNILSG